MESISSWLSCTAIWPPVTFFDSSLRAVPWFAVVSDFGEEAASMDGTANKKPKTIGTKISFIIKA
jgi:hypothetical protein